MLAAAAAAIGGELGRLVAASPVIATLPVGPSSRSYANAALLLRTALAPADLLDRLLALEARFGRVRRGQRWRARVLDCDIILWSGGPVRTRRLVIPHPLYGTRDFVLGPAAAIAPRWRDPHSGRTLAQLHARLTARAPVPRWPRLPAPNPAPASGP